VEAGSKRGDRATAPNKDNQVLENLGSVAGQGEYAGAQEKPANDYGGDG
jgi:hypothetical protein